MSSSVAPSTSWADRLPTKVTKTVHGLAIASLVSQVGIIISGGAVRLTKSGLGCSQWPNCMPGTMTPVPEMGIHGFIEFGNRLLTFVLMAIALAFLVAIWRMRSTHRSLFVIGWVLLIGIPFQGVIGGITVWSGLNPWVVSLHFLLSMALVMLATVLVNRTGREYKHTPAPVQDKTIAQVSWVAWIASMLAIIFGTVVTGTGPHAGDASAPRHLFDPLTVTRMHTAPVYLLIGATIVLLVLAAKRKAGPEFTHGLYWLVGVLLLQAAIGYIQHFTGLPIVLVILHMLGSALLGIATTNVWDRAVRLPKYEVPQHNVSQL
ncbi:heme A synthase [Glutamicibacter creatinolyticus]|uniref:Heme A synthase n=1 Tax=Glutamicibacter creatinolyticus TaxID=162496 RepID=A0A5B7WTI8_9MICC|nr:COX15/CtaA family protein [Glutamicibacter creatinolyticus]QCY47386.1 Heme A synthase [Glutamicibacter creatinolyticus]